MCLAVFKKKRKQENGKSGKKPKLTSCFVTATSCCLSFMYSEGLNGLFKGLSAIRMDQL